MSSFFFLMIRRPPRSTLFPTRRSSDLRARSSSRCRGRVFAARAESRRSGGRSWERESTRLNSSPGDISDVLFFFFNDTATTEIYTLPYTTLFRSTGPVELTVPRARLRGASGEPQEWRSQLGAGEHTSELQSRRHLGCPLFFF